ncbi:MAG: hypothetical protein KIS74_02860 [Burkholderiales bacterium]|nr:hypothetical protein [Burkholderiales bacterium]
MKLSVGTTYRVDHTRKGRFTVRLTRFDDTWATGVVVDGLAAALLPENERGVGEEVTFRRSFATFSELGLPEARQ